MKSKLYWFTWIPIIGWVLFIGKFETVKYEFGNSEMLLLFAFWHGISLVALISFINSLTFNAIMT